MIDTVLRSYLRHYAAVIAFLIPVAVWGQSNPWDGIEQGATGNVETASPSDGTNLPMDELLERLYNAERRLSMIESQRAEMLGMSGDGETTFVNTNTTTMSEAYFAEEAKPKKWYEKYTLRGYAQFRINETISLDPGSAPAQHVGDSSVGEDQSFLIRRARLIISGDVTDRIAIYLQPDFASSIPGSPDANQFCQIRDWYADLHLDDAKVNRIRVGQSKIPYGWENMQSSMNRLPLDRNDAFNSGAKNERDLGVFYYWTPEYAQETFKFITDEGLKGSGNYGVFGIGAYNGQGGSFREQNDNLHVIARLTLPMTLESGQIVEAGVQAYTGQYTVLSSAISPLGVGAAVRPAGTLETGNIPGILDERIGASFIYYPQPLGFQAEWTTGRGPALNDAQTAVIEQDLHGGYAMTMYRMQTECHGELWPFVRWAFYEGGYKSERNAPNVHIDEWEIGLEWQFSKNLELVGMYTVTDRTNTRAISAANALSYEQFSGDLARFQLQVNY